jgi:hypothetical protein
MLEEIGFELIRELKAYLLHLVDVSALISYYASKRVGRGLNWEKILRLSR